MGKNIGTLAYSIVADTRNFTSGIVLTRNEAKLTKAVFESTQGPISRFSNELAGLNQLKGKGAISGMQYVSSLNQMVAAHTSGIPVIGKFTSLLALGNPLLIAGATATATFAAGIGAVYYAVGKIREQYKAIDNLSNSAANLGMSIGSFQELAFGADLADIEVGKFSKGMETMLTNVAKAAAGSTKLKKSFIDIGLSAKELRELRPEEILRRVTVALSETGNASTRMKSATAIFGDADFLRLSLDDLEDAKQLLADMGGKISDIDETKFEDMDVALKKLHMSLDITWRKVAISLAPVIRAAAEEMTGFVVSANKLNATPDNLQKITDTGMGTILMLKALKKEMEKQIDATQGPLVEMFQEWQKEIEVWGKVTSAFDQAFKPKTVSGQKPMGTEKYMAGVIDLDEPDKQEMIKSYDHANDAARMLESAMTPAEKFRRELEEIQLLLSFDVIDQSQFDKLKTALDASHPVNQTIKALEDQASQLLLGANAYQLMQAAMNGADADQQKYIKGLQDSIEEQKEFNKLQDDTKSALESLKSPYDKAREDIERYAEMLEQGLINPEQFKELREKRIGDLRSSQKSEEFRNPAQLRGSQEALQTIANAKFGKENTFDDMAESLRDINRKTREDDIELPVIASFSKG